MVIKNGHQKLSSKIVIKNCHENCHQKLSKKIVINKSLRMLYGSVFQQCVDSLSDSVSEPVTRSPIQLSGDS